MAAHVDPGAGVAVLQPGAARPGVLLHDHEREAGLLQPDRRTVLSFEAGRATSRRMRAGSRLLAVVSVLRNPQQQINYGSGKPVAAESIADAGEPLRVRWYGGSYLEIPLSR